MRSRNLDHAADDETGFDDLIERLRTGESQATEEVWARFVEPLLTVAHRHLDDAIRPKVDADDIVQSAYFSFFVRLREGQFELANWSSMWGLLVRITVRKCTRKAEFYRTQQRDVGRELPLVAGDSSARPLLLNDTGPAPDERSIMSEIIEELVGEFTKPYERRVVYQLLEGWSIPDICADVGRSEYTVRRAAQQIKRRLEAMRDEY